MSFFSRWNQGSLFGSGTLHARENYRPTTVLPSAEMAFAHWTERSCAQPELVTAREIAGLSHDNLAVLAAEFEQAPRRTRRDVYRLGVPWGLALIIVGGFTVALGQLTGGGPLVWGSGVAALVVGVVGLSIGVAMAFSMVDLDAAYAKVGLNVGELNEQHPWLYKTLLLMNNAGAEDYRHRILKERGVLRGVDYLMMHQIALAHENMEMTQSARRVREQVQGLPGTGQ